MSTRTALPLVKPFLEGLFAYNANSSDGIIHTNGSDTDHSKGTPAQQTPLHFCVDETSQRRRELAEIMAAATSSTTAVTSSNETDHKYHIAGNETRRWALGWWIMALELKGVENVGGAISWLEGYAPETVTP